jgi:hypothetical protein
MELLSEDAAMWPLDSYRDVLSEHARSPHLVGSAWIILLALAVLLVLFA